MDRLLCSDYYYFYDDIEIPSEALLIGAEHKLLPSQKEKLLLAEGESPESELFGHLWMRLCAKSKSEYYKKEQSLFWCLGLVWFVLVGFLELEIDDYWDYWDDPVGWLVLPWLVVNVTTLAAVLYPIIV